jgi:hypothetical protein
LSASASMPFLLDPVKITIGGDQGIYVSGEIAVGSDPALHLFLVATEPAFPFRWRKGARRIFMLALGTGTSEWKASPKAPAFEKAWPILQGITSLQFAFDQHGERNDMVLAALAHEGLHDSMVPVPLSGGEESSPSVIHYVKFDIHLCAQTFDELGLARFKDKLDLITSSGHRIDQIDTHLEIGRRAADRALGSELFSPSFDVRPRPKTGPIGRDL